MWSSLHGQHRFSVPVMISASELGLEAFRPGSHTVVAFEAVGTVNWKGLQLGRDLPGHRAPNGPRMPAPGTPEPSACPGTTMPLAAARAPVPYGSIFLSLPLSCTPFPLVLDFLPHSYSHMPGWDHAAPQLCALTLSPPRNLLPPPRSHLSILSVFIGTWNFLAWHRLKA